MWDLVVFYKLPGDFGCIDIWIRRVHPGCQANKLTGLRQQLREIFWEMIAEPAIRSEHRRQWRGQLMARDSRVGASGIAGVFISKTVVKQVLRKSHLFVSPIFKLFRCLSFCTTC